MTFTIREANNETRRNFMTTERALRWQAVRRSRAGDGDHGLPIDELRSRRWATHYLNIRGSALPDIGNLSAWDNDVQMGCRQDQAASRCM